MLQATQIESKVVSGKEDVMSIAKISKKSAKKEDDEFTIYEEKTLGKTLFRVTSVFADRIDFKQTLEDSIVKRILLEIQSDSPLHNSA